MILTYVILAFLGLALGSFVNALVWRVHQNHLSDESTRRSVSTEKSKHLSIWNGRSQCVHCAHVLAPRDLVPLFSWLSLAGRCRYCKQPISIQYPIVEVILALVFCLSYYFWPAQLEAGQWMLFVSWLAASVGLLALAVYDLHWMLLPSSIIYPTALIAALGRTIYIIGYEPDQRLALLRWFASVCVSSGIFWIIFEVSRGKMIGFGDVRLGLITGTLIASPVQSFMMIFIASLLGTLYALPSLVKRGKGLQSKMPFGPFLIAATAIVVLFGPTISDWYQHLFDLSY